MTSTTKLMKTTTMTTSDCPQGSYCLGVRADSDFVPPDAGARKGRCVECNELVWVSPEVQAHLEDGTLDGMICIACAKAKHPRFFLQSILTENCIPGTQEKLESRGIGAKQLRALKLRMVMEICLQHKISPTEIPLDALFDTPNDGVSDSPEGPRGRNA